jgi:RNA polymerase-binding transcription factor DksA
MRHHFHRCANLRVIEVSAHDLSHARRGGKRILEELCDAKHLAPCIGLAECDILSPGQKRELLAVRVTQLREEEGGTSPLADADARNPRRAELEQLSGEFLDERNEIAHENRRLAAEAGGALQRNPRPLHHAEGGALGAAGLSVVLDDELRTLRAARLDALDRALDALAAGRYGSCVRCSGAIEVDRLREVPDTAVCVRCAETVFPDLERRAT